MMRRALWSSFQAWQSESADKSLLESADKTQLENTKLKSEIESLKAKLARLASLCGESTMSKACVSELQALQRTVHGFTSKVRTEISSVSLALDELVPRSLVDKKDHELRALSLECRRLKQLVKDMVPKERLDDAMFGVKKQSQSRERSAMQYDKELRTEHQRCCEELDQLKQEVGIQQAIVVPKSKLLAAEEVIAHLRSDLDDLQKRLLDMVPKHYHDRCLVELLASKSLMMGLKGEVRTHVENIQTLVQDMKQLDQDLERGSASPMIRSGGLSLERARAISFAVPAAGLAMGQAGRLAPFMMQVSHVFVILGFAVSFAST
jgi:hypothetical protein